MTWFSAACNWRNPDKYGSIITSSLDEENWGSEYLLAQGHSATQHSENWIPGGFKVGVLGCPGMSPITSDKGWREETATRGWSADCTLLVLEEVRRAAQEVTQCVTSTLFNSADNF